MSRVRRLHGPDAGRTLTDQLPESGFPSGVDTPSGTVLALLLLLAGLCTFLLDVHEYGTASATVVESQVDLVRDVSSAIGAAADQDIADLLAGAAGPAATPDRLLGRVLWNEDWRGAAVLDAARTPVAAGGEPVPTRSLPATVTGTSITPVRDADGARLVLAKPLPDGRLLVAARRAPLPDSPAGGETLLLVTSTGRVIDGARHGSDGEIDRLVRTASAAAAKGRQGSTTGPVAGADDGATQPVVAYAPVPLAGLAGARGLSVVSVARAPVTETDSGGMGIVAALTLGGLAAFGFLLVRLVLVEPTRRLRADALGVAGGRLETTLVRRSTTREVDRIAAAFEHCRSTLDDTAERSTRRRRGISALLAVVLAALAVLGWSVGVLVAVASRDDAGGELHRNGMVVALIGILFALLLFGWQYLLAIRPLRRVAAAADELVAGRRDAVIYPQHQDQIGTIASCLEVCRQALTDGTHRLGTVRRPSGAATEDTALIRVQGAAG